MIVLLLILAPALAGAAAFAVRADGPRRALLAGTALAHAGLTAASWLRPEAPAPGAWLGLDDLGRVVLGIVSLLFLAASAYAVGYLRREDRGERTDLEEGFLFANAPEAVFTGCLLLFLAAMTLTAAGRHLGLLWVGVETTTLASAPLIYFHRHRRSLEATWKYLLLCSVGIGIALLGTFFLAAAAAGHAGGEADMTVDGLAAAAPAMQVRWLRAAFVLLLVGYGTKMGLAPLHTWLPDAHSEAPSVVSALLSGALLNCAFLGVLRGLQVCSAAGEGAFARNLLVGFGLLSMAVAAVFILNQVDYKRMLAYSSVEHMGILALGAGLGGAGMFGALLHAVNHGLVKAMMFLVAGNLLARYRSKASADVRGALRLSPTSGFLWLAGFLALSGCPPFGTFLSEFTLLRAAWDGGRPAVAAAYVAALSVIFVGLATPCLRMTLGPAPRTADAPAPEDGGPESWLAVVPPALLGAAALLLGLYVPPGLTDLLQRAARLVGGGG